MYRRCTLEKAVQTQKRYEECLVELMKYKPYEEITINDICERMGTSQKSFYHFFKSKVHEGAFVPFWNENDTIVFVRNNREAHLLPHAAGKRKKRWSA